MGKNMRIRSIWCAVFFLAVPLYEALGDDPTCGEPPTIDLASLTSSVSSENPVGTTVTYTCHFGYVIDGTSRTSTCELSKNRKEAKWSDPRVTCIPRSCGDPGFVTNGHRLGSLFTFPNSVSYECEEGFRLQGNGRRFCQASGSWSGRLPRCETVSCDPPNNPENGQVTYTSLEFGAELKFECNTGYALEDKTPVHCRSDGTWSKTDVACIEKKCDVPQKPEYGTMEFIGSAASPMAGTLVVFTCEGDLIPSGPTTSKCLSTGEWTFPAPSCLEPCSIPFVQNGRIGKWVPQSFGRGPKYQATPVGQRIEDGDKFFLHCDNGYRPLGITTNWQAMVVCKSGKWSDDPFCELSTCDAEPPAAENGRVEKMDRKHGGTVSYECLPNFDKVKTGNVKCDMGNWKGMPPTCKDIRCHAESVRYRTGVAEISKVTLHGDLLQVRCKEGYELRPNLQQCWNGEWRNNQESPCKQKDCTVPWISNGHIEEQILGPSEYNWWKVKWERKTTYRTVKIGSVPSRDAKLFLVCDDRYSIQGTSSSLGSIICSEGRWSPDLVCLRTGTQYKKATEAPVSLTTNRVTPASATSSPRATTVSDESRFVSGTIGSKSTTTTGTPVVSKLRPEANNEESYVPPDSEEFEDECYCEYIPDGNLVAHADGKEVKMNDKVKNGTVLQLRCEKVGFHRLLGPTEVLCNNCKPWSSSDFPSCINPTRGDTIIVYEGVNVSLSGVLEPRKGQSLRLSCTTMETKGFPTWRFPNVIGIDVTEERRERTGDILYLSHLDIRNITSKYNGSYSCAFDETNPTIVQLQVVDPEARCRRFPIDEVEELDVEYDGADTRVGRRATFSCQRNGQNLNGTSVATCLKSEEWSSPPPKCIDIMCRELKDSDLMTISYTDNRKIGSFANFHCFAPGIRSGVARTQCLENGEWKDSSPICSTPPCPSESLSQVIPNIVVYNKDDVTNSTMPYNSTVELMCRADKNLVGIPFARCGSEGKWEVGNITCILGCPPFIKAAGSGLSIKPDKDSYRIGESVTLSCLPGHKLSKDLEIVMCLQSGWSERALPECIKSDASDEGESQTSDNWSN